MVDPGPNVARLFGRLLLDLACNRTIFQANVIDVDRIETTKEKDNGCNEDYTLRIPLPCASVPWRQVMARVSARGTR